MLIKKNACECNKCGKIDIVELDVFAANVILTGEEFYLCKDCIAPIMDYITSGKTTIEEKPTDLRNFVEYEPVEKNEKPPEPEESEPKEKNDLSKATFAVVPNNWDPKTEKAREYVMWSDYEIDKIVDMHRKGFTWKQIAKGLKLTISQIYSLLANIRNPKGVLNKEKYVRWAKQYPDVFIDTWKSKDGHKNNSPAIDKFSVEEIEEILEMHKNGETWINISDKKGVGRNTLWRLTSQLEQSKPGDRTYDIAVKYGYVVE